MRDVEVGLSRDSSLLLKRRYYLVERLREAHIVGILVGQGGGRVYLGFTLWSGCVRHTTWAFWWAKCEWGAI